MSKLTVDFKRKTASERTTMYLRVVADKDDPKSSEEMREVAGFLRQLADEMEKTANEASS